MKSSEDDLKKILDRTTEITFEDLNKSIPIICSWCNKIYHIKNWQVEKGKRTGVSHGTCPDCEKKQKSENQK